MFLIVTTLFALTRENQAYLKKAETVILFVFTQ